MIVDDGNPIFWIHKQKSTNTCCCAQNVLFFIFVLRNTEQKIARASAGDFHYAWLWAVYTAGGCILYYMKYSQEQEIIDSVRNTNVRIAITLYSSVSTISLLLLCSFSLCLLHCRSHSTLLLCWLWLEVMKYDWLFLVRYIFLPNIIN
jgi:hypothetical protein